MIPRRFRQPGTLALSALAVAVLAVYGPALSRYFTSEDFLILRVLREHPPWESWPSFMASSWLGISVVKFYRPVSTLLLAIEAWIFGAAPLGYNAVHLSIHLLNAYLVWRIARRIAGTPTAYWTPLAIALLFALYPLHPNTVSFIASFATLFSTAFLLLSFDAYQRRAFRLSLAAFVLALGSYEAAVILPGLLLAHDLLLPRGDEPDPKSAVPTRFRRLVLGWAPFAAALVGYLVLRRAVLGVAVGGYEDAGRRLLAPQLLTWARNFSLSVWWLHIPRFAGVPSATAATLLTVLLVAGPLIVCLLRWKTTQEGRRWLFGWVWVVLALLPFSFEPAVPGNGRYWYLASIGLAMTIAFLARWFLLTPAVGRIVARPVAVAAVGLLGMFWALLLVDYIGIYRAAGRISRSIQQQILRLHGQEPTAELLFITNHPLFLRNAQQTPIAQVYHYGLADAVRPPFTDKRVTAYPLPALSDPELEAVTRGRPQALIARWNAATLELRRVDTSVPRPLPQIEPLAPAEQAVLDRERLFVAVRAVPGAASYRLIVVTEGNATEGGIASAIGADGVLRAPLPLEFIESMDHLYGSEMYWWIQALDANGLPVAASPLRGFHFSRSR